MLFTQFSFCFSFTGYPSKPWAIVTKIHVGNCSNVVYNKMHSNVILTNAKRTKAIIRGIKRHKKNFVYIYFFISYQYICEVSLSKTQ